MKKKFFLNGFFGFIFFLFATLIINCQCTQKVYAASGKTYALLISGMSEDASSLMVTDNSVDKMETVICNNRLSAYSGKKHITIFKNKMNNNNSTEVLNQYIDRAYAGAQKNDLAIFYYNGHSRKDVGLFLNSQNIYSYSELAKYLSSRIKCSKIIVIIDSCYAGDFLTKGLSQISKENKHRFIAFLACYSDQAAQSIWGNSRFTKHLTTGLGYGLTYAAADLNSDGVVTVLELWDYIRLQLKQDLLIKNIPFAEWQDQLPVIYMDSNIEIYQSKESSEKNSLTLDKTSIKMWKGSSATIHADKNKITGTIKWSTSNPNVVTVNSKGKIKAQGIGKATIKATVGNISKTCKVTVKKPTIKLNKYKLAISLGSAEKTRLKATAYGYSTKIKWKSSNPKIASVSKNGLILPKKTGKVTVSATANGVTAKCVVTVKPSIKLNKKSAVLYTSGQRTVQLKATVKGNKKKVVWKSSDEKIVVVTQNGKVTAKKIGTAKITAKANGVTATCVITVKQPEKPSITLEKTDITLSVGESNQLTASVKNSVSAIVWTSSDSSIASVDKNGVIKANKVGVAYITAAIQGISAVCRITVNEEILLANTVSAGGRTSAFIKKDGSLWIWGNNWYGQAGFRENICYNQPQKLMNNISKVVLGDSHSAAITKDGKLYLWGGNWCGQLGNNSTEDSCIPIYIMDNVADVSLGGANTAILTSNGSLYMCGDNTYAQIDSSCQDVKSPKKIMSNVKKVSVGGDSTAVVKTDGSLWAWGRNCNGQIGNGEISYNVSEPTQIMSGSVADVAMGGYFCAALLTNGALYTWGRNWEGQLGQNTDEGENPTPTLILTSVKKISLGEEHGMAIKTNGTLYTWGDNIYGQIGNGTTSAKTAPTAVLNNVKDIGAGARHSIAVKENGYIYVWGSNDRGALGNGTYIDSSNVLTSPSLLVNTGV